MGKQVTLLFNISKSVDMYLSSKGVNSDVYMEDMPYTLSLNADTIITIKTHVAAALLQSLVSGDATFSVEACVDSVLGTILCNGNTKIELAIAAVQAETQSILGSIKPFVNIETVALDSFVSTMAGSVLSNIQVNATIHNTTMTVCSSADGHMTIGSMLSNTLIGATVSDAKSKVSIETTVKDSTSILESKVPCSIKVSTSLSGTEIVYFRTVSECDELTIEDLGSLTLETFYMTKL